MNVIEVVLADNQPLTLCGLRSSIADHSDIRILAECTERECLMEVVSTHAPQVLLVSTELLREEFDPLQALKEDYPHTRVLLLTARQDSAFLQHILRLGINGVFKRERPVHHIPIAIRTVNRGELWFERAVTEGMLSDLLRNGNGKKDHADGEKKPPVSAREQEVIELICQGLRNKEISERLHISEATVSHHLTSIFRKLEVEDRVSLVLHAVRHHLVAL